MKTLNGFLLNDLPSLLDQPLPPQAYKPIPGGAGLTDIDAGWQRRAFNKIFGLYGFGWGFDFEHNQIDIRHEENAKQRIIPYAKVYGKFWYAYLDEMGRRQRAEFPVTGANSNQSGTGAEGYTLKGAITNAIGFGASMIGWQESVYLGARSHNNTEGFAEGKGWTDVLPEEKAEPAPPPAPVVKKAEELKAKKSEPAPAPEPLNEPAAPEPTPEPVAPEKSLAENLGFQSIRHIVCQSCGYAEPVNIVPSACPGCGDVAGIIEVDSHAIMVSSAENIKRKLQAKVAAADSKEILERIKHLCKNDRRLILSTLSKATGRDIKNYSECSPEEMQKALYLLPDQPVDNPEPKNDKPKSKKELIDELYAVARSLNIGGPRAVIAEICNLVGRQVVTAAHLDEAELLKAIETFKERSV